MRRRARRSDQVFGLGDFILGVRPGALWMAGRFSPG